MRRFMAALAALCCGISALGQGDGTASSVCVTDVAYDQYFAPERLRVDMVLAGDSAHEYAFLSELHKEALWAGSPSSLIDRSGYGQYFFELFAEGRLVYSRGFSTLFEEWRSTPQADRVQMAMNQTLWMPFPKQCVHLVLYRRSWDSGRFETLFECDIDPRDRHIIPGAENDYSLVPLMVNGDRAHKLDLVFVAEGYTSAQADKYHRDAARMMEYLFSMEPYSRHRQDFNVWMIDSFAAEEGVDIPQAGQWRQSVCESGFDTFYEDRYLTVTDHRKIASAASGAPFDALFVLANESKYGGGGIYNSYAMGTADHHLSEQVFIHEFGHSFAALADEYYDSSVAYENYYNLAVEPWEPNITTRVDFGRKWADMIEPSTPVPTANDRSNMGRVGVFEGAGYMARGCFRPYFECRMLNNTAPGFCPVCQRAIESMIDFYVR